MAVVDEVRARYLLLKPAMNERMERLWAAAEAKSLGFGGGAIVTAATGIRCKRIWLGKRDLDQMAATPPAEAARHQRIRRPGGGRKRLTEVDPTLKADLDALVDSPFKVSFPWLSRASGKSRHASRPRIGFAWGQVSWVHAGGV